MLRGAVTESAPESASAPPRPTHRRRRHLWRAFVAALLLGLLYVLYGGRLGGPSPRAQVRGELISLRYPSALGRARVRRLGGGLERVQLGGFGEPVQRGPKAALRAVMRMTRAGGLLIEVRGLASDAEGDYLLRQAPYACTSTTDAHELGDVAGFALRQAQRSWLFRWLPASVSLCGTRRESGLLVHASGFATEGTWLREGESLRAMLRGLQVERERVSHEAHGCRLHTGRDTPLYVQFKSEPLAEAGVVAQDTVHWLDLPYRSDAGVGRFTPDELQEVASACAREHARFSRLVGAAGQAGERSAEAQDAHHAFRARCEPLFPMLRFFGADTFAPEALPRPRAGFRYTLDKSWVPALCLPAQ